MLALLAKKKAALRAGGVAGIDDAARIVLRDFMAGKLKYFTPCPKATIADSDSDWKLCFSGLAQLIST